MEASELLDHILAGSEVEVVRVAEDDGRAHLPHLVGMQRLHRPLRPDRHERGRRDVPVEGRDDAGPGDAVEGLEREAGHRMSMASPKE